jgi:gliding motility-associated protein GldM
VNDSIEATNRNFESKIVDAYNMFEKALAENREKVQANNDKAREAQRLTAEFRQYIRDARSLLVHMATGVPIEEAADLSPHDIGRQDDYDTPSLLFINQGKGAEMREKIGEYERTMLELLPEHARANIRSAFDIEGPFFDNSGKELTWEQANFFKAIIVAAITILNKLENDAMNLEYDVVNQLLRLVSEGDLTFDNVVARIVPKSTFVALGETFEAEVFLVAFDSRTRVTANINGQTFVSRDGIIHYTAVTTQEGVFPVAGHIILPGGGTVTTYPFKTEYIVAAPSATVSADAMNVFYVGVDNPISTAVSGVDPSNVIASITGAGGTLTPVAGSNNRYIARVTSAGTTTVTLSVRSGDQIKPAGSFTYRVKRVPDPIASVPGFDEHTTIVDRDILASAGGLTANMKDFDFDLVTRVTSFTMSTTVGG